MSGAEIPQFDANSNSFAAAAPERLENPLDTLVKNRIREFGDTLEAKRMPDTMHYSFTFHANTLTGAYVPESLHKLIKKYGPLDEITVECSYLDGSGGTSFDVQFEFCDEIECNSTYLRLHRPYNYKPGAQDYDYVYGGEYDEEQPYDSIRPVTERDLNRCLASLIRNDPEIITSALDARSWIKSDYEQLIASLVDAASYHSSHYEYLLTDGEGGDAGSYGYEEVEGDITERYLYRIVAHNVDISAGGNLGYYKKAVETSVDEADDTLDAYFCEHAYFDDRYANNLLTPAETDYQAACDFIDQQTALLQTEVVRQPEDDAA